MEEGGGGGGAVTGQAEECEGIKIIKVSFIANMKPSHEQTLKGSSEKSAALW